MYSAQKTILHYYLKNWSEQEDDDSSGQQMDGLCSHSLSVFFHISNCLHYSSRAVQQVPDRLKMAFSSDRCHGTRN